MRRDMSVWWGTSCTQLPIVSRKRGRGSSEEGEGGK